MNKIGRSGRLRRATVRERCLNRQGREAMTRRATVWKCCLNKMANPCVWVFGDRAGPYLDAAQPLPLAGLGCWLGSIFLLGARGLGPRIFVSVFCAVRTMENYCTAFGQVVS